MQVTMIQPFTNKDFAIRSLGDRIKDLTQCVTLYPDIPKEKAFGNYFTQMIGKRLTREDNLEAMLNQLIIAFSSDHPPTNGYVRPELKVVVGSDTVSNSYPNTPHSNWQSPEHMTETQPVGRYVGF